MLHSGLLRHRRRLADNARVRVVFVNRYFHPDLSATSQLLTDLTSHLAARGWDVGVITSRQLYDDPAARLASRERVGGVEVRRIATTRFGRAFLPLRAIDYLTFYAGAFRAIRRERGALVVTLTDPPLISIVAALASRRLVTWTQDLFPEVARALGVRTPPLLGRLRDWSLRRARVNVAIGEQMARRIAGRTVVQHNWAGGALHPIPRPPSAPFTVAYSGNLGRAHDSETLLAAMRGLPEVRFVMTGGGAQMERLRAAAPENVEFRPYAPRERLSESLSDADLHVVTLQPALEGLIVPSKFYGVLAVGRPVLYVGAEDGEVGRIIGENGCGVVVAPGDSGALIDAIRTLASDRERRLEMGVRARALYERRFDAPLALSHWETILREACDE